MLLAAGEEGAAGAEQQLDVVRYLPALDFDLPQELDPAEGAQVMPCFPLGGITYVPYTNQVLNIFEPRYRQMYSDILMSGGRRFVVPQVTQDETGLRLSEVGVVFYLHDLKEVSEETQDQVKYVCEHKLIGRVRLRRVLNPVAFKDRSTYLRVEVEELVDSDADEDLSELEEEVMREVLKVAELQTTMDARVRFNEDALRLRNVSRDDGFWSMVGDWQSYLNSLASLRKQAFDMDVRKEIVDFLKEEQGNVPRQVSLAELPEPLQRRVVALQAQLQEDIEPLVQASTTAIQALVQSSSHRDRLVRFMAMVETEEKRLTARFALQSLFAEEGGDKEEQDR